MSTLSSLTTATQHTTPSPQPSHHINHRQQPRHYNSDNGVSPLSCCRWCDDKVNLTVNSDHGVNPLAVVGDDDVNLTVKAVTTPSTSTDDSTVNLSLTVNMLTTTTLPTISPSVVSVVGPDNEAEDG